MMRSIWTTLVLVLGCGDGAGGTPPDATPTGDGSPTARCGTPQGQATVTVTRHGVPTSGVTVVYQCPDGRWADMAKTDSDGRATFDVVADSMMTIGGPWPPPDPVNPYPAFQPTLYTITGVQAGDQLRVEPAVRPSSALNQRNLTLPGAVNGATSYRVESGCGHVFSFSYAVTISVVTFSDCTTLDDTARVWVTAGNGTGPVAFTYADIDATSPDPVVLPDWTSTFTNPTVEVDDPSADATAIVDVQTSVMFGDQRSPDGRVNYGTVPFSGGVALASFFPVPQAVATGIEYQVTVGYGDPQAPSGRAIFFHREPYAKPHVIDMGVDALPRLQSVAVDSTDPARPQISWTADGDLSGADGVVAELTWSSDSNGRWLVLAPASTTAPLILPELPTTPDTVAPTASAVFDPPALRFIDVDWLDFAQLKYDGLPGMTDLLAAPYPDATPRAPAGAHVLRETVH